MMKAGPELDALVAEKVLGWDEIHFAPEGNLSGWGGTDRPCWIGHAPGASLHNVEILPYSTDLTTCAAAAEEAIRAGKVAAWTIQRASDGQVGALVYLSPVTDGLSGVLGETPAHALALALLKAVGHE